MSDRPSMHPVDVANRVIDSGMPESPHNRVTHELSVIEDDVAVVESFSHCWIVRTDEGLVCFDAGGVSGTGVLPGVGQHRNPPSSGREFDTWW